MLGIIQIDKGGQMPEEMPMKKSKSKRKRILLIAAILVVAGLGIWYMMAAQSSDKKADDKKEVKTEAEIAKADDLNKPTDGKNASGDATASTTTTSPATSTSNLNVVINRPVNGDTLPMSEGIELRSTITGASSGTCTLNLTGPNGQKVTQSANLTAQNGYSSCSINVPGSQLAVGSWTLSFTAKSGNVTSDPIVQKVTMQ